MEWPAQSKHAFLSWLNMHPQDHTGAQKRDNTIVVVDRHEASLGTSRAIQCLIIIV